jgi:hypothetical protein
MQILLLAGPLKHSLLPESLDCVQSNQAADQHHQILLPVWHRGKLVPHAEFDEKIVSDSPVQNDARDLLNKTKFHNSSPAML